MLLTAVCLLAAAVATAKASQSSDGVTTTLDRVLVQLTEGAPEDALLTLDALTRQLARDGGRPGDLALAYLLTAAAHVKRGDTARAGAFLREAARLDPQITRHYARLPEGVREFCNSRRGELPLLPEPEPSAPRRAIEPVAPTSSGETARARPAAPRKRGDSRTALGVFGVLASGAAGSALGYLGASKGESGMTVSAPPEGGEDRRDNDGDGLSENQGDCNDSDPRVRPGGAVIVTAPYSTLATTSCREVDYVTIVLTNNSCTTVDVRSIRYVLGVLGATGGSCRGGSGAIATSERSVAPGESRAIANRAQASPANGVGCCRGACDGDTCTFVRHVTVATSVGSYTVSGFPFRVEFSNCARCPSFGVDAPMAACGNDPW